MKWEMKDVSKEVFGKYTHGFIYRGMEFSDEDEGLPGKPKWGAIPAPSSADRRPWRGELVYLWRRLWK